MRCIFSVAANMVPFVREESTHRTSCNTCLLLLMLGLCGRPLNVYSNGKHAMTLQQSAYYLHHAWLWWHGSTQYRQAEAARND